MIRERLRQLRKQLGLSQTEFASKIGVTYSTVSLLETGKIAATKQNLKLISIKWNVSENWLLNGEGDMFNDTDDQEELLEISSSMKPLIRKQFIKIGRVLLEEEKKKPKKLSWQKVFATGYNTPHIKEYKVASSATPVLKEFGEMEEIGDFGSLRQKGWHNEDKSKHRFQFSFIPNSGVLIPAYHINVSFITLSDNEFHNATLQNDPKDIRATIRSMPQDDINFLEGIAINAVEVYSLE